MIAIAQTLSTGTGDPTPPAQQERGAALWNGLSVGLSAEQTASALRQVDGIRAVKVFEKPGKPPRFEVLYVSKGVDLGFAIATVSPTFEGGRLTEFELTVDQCVSTANAKATDLVSTLKGKYGEFQRERVVNPDGSPQSVRYAFYNRETRVRVSLQTYNPARKDVNGPGSGAVGALGDIFSAIGANAAEKACPLDAGRREVWMINYSSQAAFLKSQTAEEAVRQAKLKKAHDGL